MGDIELLYFEPDILLRIFLFLDLEDLVSVEDVCSDWNDLAVSQNVWKKKLKIKSSGSSWKFLLKNHDWLHLNYKESKSLYFQLASVIISPNFGKFIENNDLVIEYEHYAKKYESTNSVFRFIKKLKTYRNRKSEENLYFERRQRDHNVIVQMLPKTIMFQAPDPQRRFVMSRLLLFGPSVFPVMVTRAGAVVMAGAYYGRGRVIVLPHENLLANTALMIGAGLWVSGQDVIVDNGDNGHKEHLPKMTVDPRSKAWSRLEGDWVGVRVGPGKTVPTYECDFLSRSRLLEVKPPMYVTQGHYDEGSEQVLEYVRRGGGLIIGGHSWWWADQSANKMPRDLATDQSEETSVLLDHPGNKMLTEFGLAFSKEMVEPRDAAFPIKTREVPSVKESFYYFAAMRARGINYRKSDESIYDELYSHSKRLEKYERFQEIIRLNNIHLSRLNM